MSYAGIEDVEVDFGGTLSADESARALVLIDRAEAQIGQRVPDLAARITAGRTSIALVRQVVAEVVADKLRNPQGYVTGTRSVTNGPFSSTESGTRATGAAVGLTLTRRQLQLLGDRRGAQSVPVGDPALAHVPVRPLYERGREFPLYGGHEGEGYVWPDPWAGL